MRPNRSRVQGQTFRQLSLPGVLVQVSALSAGPLLADDVGWHRAVAQADLPRATKLVALVLASHVQAAGETDRDLPPGAAFCTPGLPLLVAQTGYSRTHVQRQLAKLRQLGWLGTTGRPAAGRPARFVLALPAQVAQAAGVGPAASAGQAAGAARDQSQDDQPRSKPAAEPRVDDAGVAGVDAAEPGEVGVDEAGLAVACGDRGRSGGGRHVFRRRSTRPMDPLKSTLRRRAQAVGAFAEPSPTGPAASGPAASGPAASGPDNDGRDGTKREGTREEAAAEPRADGPHARGDVERRVSWLPFDVRDGVPPGHPAAAAFGRPASATPAVRFAPVVPVKPSVQVGSAVVGDAGTAAEVTDPPEPAVPETVDPVVVAARQVLATLARAMRCEPAAFDDSMPMLTEIVRDGGWTAPTLATHLVQLVVGGVRVGSDSPGDNLAWRLKHLPRTSDQCPCTACRSWRSDVARRREKAASRLAQPPRADGEAPPPVLPDLAELERAAAIGAEQAALLARARAS